VTQVAHEGEVCAGRRLRMLIAQQCTRLINSERNETTEKSKPERISKRDFLWNYWTVLQ